MLRSAGYFSGVECPCEKDDVCRRPYCPFRHKTSTKRAHLAVSNNALVMSSEDIDNAIEKIKSDIYNGQNDPCSSNSIIDDNNYNPLPETYEPATPQTSTYTPAQSSKTTKTSVLHGARGASKSLKAPLKSILKDIYRTEALTHPKTDMEYDPVVNYSTSGKKKKAANVAYDSEELSSESQSGTAEETDEITEVGNAEECDEDCFVIDEGSDDHETKEAVAEIFGTESDSEPSVSRKSSSTNVQTSLSCSIVISSDDDSASDRNKKKNLGVVTSNLTEKKIKKKKLSTLKMESSKGELKNGSATKKKTNERTLKTSSKSLKRKKEDVKKDRAKVKKKKIDLKDAKFKKKKNGLLTAKDIEISDISSYIDRDEIKKLEKELEGGDRFDECLRIYQEGIHSSEDSEDQTERKKVETPKPDLTPQVPVIEEVQATFGKRRVAHSKATSSAENLRRPLGALKRISTPSQMMMKRLDIIEKEEAESFFSGKSSSGRTAHKVSDKMSALRTSTSNTRVEVRKLEKKVQGNPWYPTQTDEPTVCGTATKGIPRVAHPSKELAALKNGSSIPPRPRIAVDRFSKVPSNIRQRYLTTFIDECMRIWKNNHDKAYEMAQSEEEKCKKRSNTKNIYLSLAASALKKLRDMPVKNTDSNTTETVHPKSKRLTSESSASKSKSRKVMSHGKLLDTNTKKCTAGYTIEKREEKSDLSTGELYEKLCRYIMTPEELDANGYPRPSNVPGKAEFRSDPPLKPFNTSDKKICVHCGKEFMLDKKGRFSTEEECNHHWGRAYMTRVGKGWEKRYSCCQERVGVEGCTIGDTHVHADNKLDRSGYMRTLSKSPPPDGNCGIFTLDCEMSYTTIGLELTRVSVLDHTCKLVYDTFVKPGGRVLDYNTRWSGITEEELRDVKTTIRDVQAVFLAKFSADTILMGHSLESDLVALRIIHETVIDTSIVFPHKKGPPFKRALRNVASENLGLIIQTGASAGHDSAEDAAACMKLMLWKLDEDSKVSSQK